VDDRREGDRHGDEPLPPGTPSRGAYLLAFAAVVVSGLLGATIGYGLVDVSCGGSCGAAIALGALVGAATAAGGVAVIATLVLRAMAEWGRRQR
jgi:hypothetical protein